MNHGDAGVLNRVWSDDVDPFRRELRQATERLHSAHDELTEAIRAQWESLRLRDTASGALIKQRATERVRSARSDMAAAVDAQREPLRRRAEAGVPVEQLAAESGRSVEAVNRLLTSDALTLVTARAATERLAVDFETLIIRALERGVQPVVTRGHGIEFHTEDLGRLTA